MGKSHKSTNEQVTRNPRLGKKGNAVCMVEFDQDNKISSVKSAIIDGEILKEDVFSLKAANL